MNKIGIYICNFNGKRWVIKCLESLYRQSVEDFDIYVVDNASSDGTVEAVKKIFGTKVSFLCNEINLGGSGGFEKGIQDGLNKGYFYIVLLDNDIVLDEHVIENMRAYLELHSDVGIVGSKVMIMDKPDTIQDYGARLDFKQFKERPDYTWQKDNENIPEINECDYVPTCAVMIRAVALKESGTMPIENFIYYDDIELSYKIKRNGWKVTALGNSKVWHKGGFNKVASNTFPKYYFFRNRLHFFSKYIHNSMIDDFIDHILSELFALMYGYHNKGLNELFQTMIFAFDDFLHLNFGEAENHKILQITDRQIPFERLIEDKSCIEIGMLDNFRMEDELDIYHILLYIIGRMQAEKPKEKIWVSLRDCIYTEKEFLEKWDKTVKMDKPVFPIPQIIVSEGTEVLDLRMQLCQHVKLVSKSILPIVYVDQYCNCIISERDYDYFTKYKMNEEFFKEIYRPLMKQAVKKIREQMNDYAG